MICLDYVLRMSIDLIKNGFIPTWHEADVNPQKLLQTQTTQMIQRFLQIRLLKPYCISSNRIDDGDDKSERAR